MQFKKTYLIKKILSLIKELTLLIYSVYLNIDLIHHLYLHLQTLEPPIICYKYNKPIRNTILNFNKHVSDLDFHANTPE